MTKYDFILSIVKQIEDKFGIICYAHEEPWGERIVWHICLSDYDIYMGNKTFKLLCNAWHKIAKNKGLKLLFCYANPIEKKLLELAEADNLIMNIE